MIKKIKNKILDKIAQWLYSKIPIMEMDEST